MTKLNPRDRAAPAWVQAHWAKGGTNGRPARPARDAEKEMLIRAIRDYAPSESATTLRRLDLPTLTAVYKTLRGY